MNKEKPKKPLRTQQQSETKKFVDEKINDALKRRERVGLKINPKTMRVTT